MARRKQGRPFTTKKCVIEGCWEKQAYELAGLCHTCYHGFNYWRGRSVTDMMRWDVRLARLKGRMGVMIGKRRGRAKVA